MTVKSASRSNKRRTSEMKSPPSETKPRTYAGRLAARLRNLRNDRGWKIETLAERLLAAGTVVPTSSIYAYELGSERSGKTKYPDLPHNLFPAYAAAFGFKSVWGLLPPQ
jgi:hypothetical protein